MSKPGLNTHVFGQSVYNWIALPSETGQTVELPIPPVKDMKEALAGQFLFITCFWSDQPPRVGLVATRKASGFACLMKDYHAWFTSKK
jgi:hypothetical protein